MQWIPFLSFVLAACYTPGPNIIFAMNTARLFGFRKTVPLMTGMTVGLFVVMLLNAIGNIFIGALIPQILPWLRGIGAIYLFWLAWKIAFPKGSYGSKGNAGQEKVPGIRDGFTLQFVNPKVILFGFTAMSSFIAPWTDSKLIFFLCGLFLTLNCAVAFVLWSLFGDVQGRVFSKQGRVISLIMGALLAWCAFSVSGIADLL
ncbi:MAG: LysE family transporter [Synergistaceae bacterium]|jgi:threonine/homoserine/homoserine lactone efflux protein|nr:LysE family transporter [Synergistaceae bacterium]MDD3673254.1 LysE family transporter [Synergistaceae bacterium]MDY0283783.1 LysE family transporter [Synergistaceae bacterium]